MARLRCIQTCWMVVCLMLAFPAVVHAHQPLQTSAPATRADPIVVSDHQVSRVALTQLTDPGEVDYYRFTVEKGEEIFGSMLIPKLDRLKDFHPAFALVGPELPTETEGIPVEDILELREDEGVLVALYRDEEPKVFFEPFTQTAYWQKQELRAVAPSDGEYYFAVFDPTRKMGKYVFCIGERDTWKMRDLLAMPVIWWRTRMFAEERISTCSLVGLLVLTIAAISYKLKPKHR